MDEKSLKPQLRFKGFADAWEQRKLSKIATMHARIGWQNLRKSEFLDSGDYYLITGTDFDDGKAQTATAPTIAVLFDDIAMGEYVTHEATRSTPFNVAGEYYNVYMNYQGKLIRLKSANQIIFTLE